MAHWLARLLQHRFFDERKVRRALPDEALARIEAQVVASEARHSGEIRVCIEAGLPLPALRRNASPRERAVALFTELGVSATQARNGVLIYLLLAERAIEIVADRGLSQPVDAGEWQRILATMQGAFASGRFEAGLSQAIAAVDALLVRHFAIEPGSRNPNELPDAPVVR
ncbi:MAG: TPM domain-containing protein [Burkholderiales bacterium]|nr:TPM domain-containing protein [Burkholderiales bacterium]